MSQGSSLVKNTLIIAVGKLSTQFLTFLLLPLYTAFLSPESYGQLDLITVYLGLLVATLTVQMEMSVFRYLVDIRGGDEVRAGRIVSSSLVVASMGAVLGVVGILICGAILDLRLAPYVAGVFFTMVFLNFFLQVARGFGRNDLYAIGSIVSGLTNILLSVIALVVLGLSLDGILGALIIANVLSVFFLLIKTGVASRIRLRYIDKTISRELLSYSWPLVPNHVAVWGIAGVSRTIVASVLGFVAAGVYAAASKFTMIYTSLYSVFAMSWTESVSLHLGKKDDFLSRASNSMVKLFASLALLIISMTAILFPVLVADNFSEARLYVPVLVIGGFFASLMTHYGAVYLAAKETVRIAAVTFQALAISVLLTLLGIWFIGLWAPAVSLIVTYLYITIRRHYDIQRLVKISYNKTMYVQLASIAFFVILCYHIDNSILNWISVAVTTLVAILINKKEITKIISTVTKRNLVDE